MVGFLVRPLHSVGRMEDFCLTRSGREVEVEGKWKRSGREVEGKWKGRTLCGIDMAGGGHGGIGFQETPVLPLTSSL